MSKPECDEWPEDILQKCLDTTAENVDALYVFYVYIDDEGDQTFGSYEVLSDDEDDNLILNLMTAKYLNQEEDV